MRYSFAMKLRIAIAILILALPILAATPEGKVEGKFVVAGADAKLEHVRAQHVKLDDNGRMGYAVLLSAKPATGDILEWRTKEPSEKGSFIVVLFNAKGEVWVAELGHVKAKSGRFGVVTELQKVAFNAGADGITAHIKTDGEQVFTEDRYNIDLTFSAPLEP